MGSNITVDSEMFISTPFDHMHPHAAHPHGHAHVEMHPNYPQMLIKCPAAAGNGSTGLRNKDDKQKETISFVPHYSSSTVTSAKQNKQFVPLRPASIIASSHQTSPAISYA